MVLDSSAVLAILLDEPERPRFTLAIERDPRRLISAASLLESALVLEARLGESAGRELDLLLHRANVQIVAVDSDQVEIARSAWRRFGKGRHPAGLNFGISSPTPCRSLPASHCCARAMILSAPTSRWSETGPKGIRT